MKDAFSLLTDSELKNTVLTRSLIDYIADYINEELERGLEIDSETIACAIDSYNGGAR